MRKLIRPPQAKPCKSPGCRRLTHNGLCIECQRKARKEKARGVYVLPLFPGGAA